MQNAEQKSLSRRQAEIADLVVAGKSSREIAKTLFLSPRTVENHVEAIFNKLGVRSRVELAAALLRARSPQPNHTAVALRSVDAIPNNLPRKLTSFIGREAEIAEIASLVGLHQCVTLVGTGGVGKTRTSLAVAETVFGTFSDGVWLVELAPLSRGEYIPGAAAQALGVMLAAEGDPLTNLTRALEPKQLLLIFDNCEHLITDVAKVVAVLVNRCHKVKVLATSREPLHVQGETTYRIPSLPVPPAASSARLSVAEALLYVSVALFVERARAVDHRFTLTGDTAATVADICRRLDGIPLAIELAAARATLLSPHQLRERLDERFRLLTGGGRDRLPRHQTLRALIDWSHDLLDEREQQLFRRLGVFVNGFTLEAASVVAGDDLDTFRALDLLASLVDKSLVIAEPHGESVRYRLLESTRVYAAEKLTEAGERDALAGRHLRHFREVFGKLHAERERAVRWDRFHTSFATELDDLRSALDSALMRADIIAGAELLAAIDRLWGEFALHGEGGARIDSFVAQLPEIETLLRASLLAIRASLLADRGLCASSRSVAANAVEIARLSGDGQVLAFALLHLAVACIYVDDIAPAQKALDEADAITGVSARIQNNLREARANLYKRIGDLDSAMLMFAQMRPGLIALGNRRDDAVVATNMAKIEHQRGRTAAAITIMHEIVPTLRQLPDIMVRSDAATALSGFLVAVNDLSAAIETAREVIAILAQPDPECVYTANAIELVALVCALCDDHSWAAILAGYVDAALARAGAMRDFTAQTTYDRLASVLREKLAPPDLARLTAEGAALSTETAIARATTVTVTLP